MAFLLPGIKIKKGIIIVMGQFLKEINVDFSYLHPILDPQGYHTLAKALD